MIRKNPYAEEKYTHYRVGEDKPLLEWLLANLKESKSKVKATLQNRGIKVNGSKTLMLNEDIGEMAYALFHLFAFDG